MKLTNIALVSAALFALTAVAGGCKSEDASDTTAANGTDLGTSESQLVADDTESSSTDDDLEAGIDDPLSGSSVADPGNPADGASDDEVLEKVRTNAGKFFTDGCLLSTREGNKIRHEFHACNGPFNLKNFDGTIISTYVRDGNTLTITHEATGFKANGAQITGSRIVVYKREGSVITKTRTGNWTGSTKNGKPISHTANFVTTYDDSSKCITREGSAQSTIGDRSFERVIADYKRCGIGAGGCPEAGGTLTLSKTTPKKEDAVTLTIAFLGENKYEITRPNGKKVERTLICNKNAS